MWVKVAQSVDAASDPKEDRRRRHSLQRLIGVLVEQGRSQVRNIYFLVTEVATALAFAWCERVALAELRDPEIGGSHGI